MTMPGPVRREPFRLREPVPRIVWVSFWIQIAQAFYGVYNVVTQSAGDASLVAVIVWRLFLVAVVVFWFWVPFKIIRGRGWARMLLTILTALGFLVLTRGPFDPLTLVTLLIGVVPVVLLWLPSANAFFAAAKAERAQYLASRLR